MKKYWIIGAISLLISFTSWSQIEVYKDENPSLKDRIYFFGSPILAIDNVRTNLGFTFGVGYMITPSLSSGVGMTYQHLTDKRYLPKLKTSQIGGNVFARMKITEQFFAYSEYEIVGYDPNPFVPPDSKEAAKAFYVGIGLHQAITDKSGFAIIALYDLLWDRDKSLNPVEISFRAGFTFSPF